MKLLAERFRAVLAAAIALLMLGSCGGVGQDGTGAAPPDTLTTGVVNGFGSVIVNGIRFDVNGAEIVVDGAAGRTQTDLRVGMVVEVTGTLSPGGASGSATRVVYESLLRGSIDDLPAARTVRVLGQSVVTDDTTVFAGVGSADELRAGDRLQVSGFRGPDGSLRATFVALEAGAGEAQLTGFITSVTGNTVRMAGLDVDITNATLEGVAAAELAPGQLVRVALQAPPVAGAAAASRLRLIDLRVPDALRKRQMQGIVASWDAGAARFSMHGVTVQLSAATQFQDGAIADLADGVRVELSGLLDANRVLQADTLRFVGSALNAYGRGRVSEVDLAGNRFKLLDIPGVEVRLRPRTLLNDISGAGGLKLDNLAVGDEVWVLGHAIGARIDAELVTRLPRITPGSGLAGPVTAIAGSTLTILGIPVATAGANFFDAQGQPVTQSAFLAALQLNDGVRAEGIYRAGVLNATTVRRTR